MSAFQNLSDQELVDLSKSGTHNAFEEIYERNWGLLFFHALKMLNDEDEAKDVVQEVFLSFWDKADKLHIKSSLAAYLFSATRNKVLNIIRDKKTRDGYVDLFSLYLADSANVVLEKVEEKELLRNIELVIQSLPEKMKLVFELSRNEHLSHKLIAERLSISEGTVKRQISNALQVLRRQLNKLEMLILAAILANIK
jgi:RNA polymerase sigma-70 factor (ECF subfamily)